MEYTFDDFNSLAYEFAIRNPRVIELLGIQDITDEIVNELLTYGMDATKEVINEYGQEVTINSYDNLYLDYKHLKSINSNELTEKDYIPYRGQRILVNPQSKEFFFNANTIEDLDVIREYNRIKELIDTRGGKLCRLMDGKPFNHYDAVIFQSKTIYSLDQSKKTTKTINTDIKFITEWINPKKYLQLLPKYNRLNK